jgi:ketosteroid isomerase-like protein
MNDWLGPLLAAIDAKDVQKFISFLTEDVIFRFGNSPPVSGKDNVSKTVEEFLASIQSLRHRVTEIWQVPDAVLCEGQVAYTRLDGRVLEVPFLNVLRTRGRQVADYRIYVDASALYA